MPKRTEVLILRMTPAEMHLLDKAAAIEAKKTKRDVNRSELVRLALRLAKFTR